MNEVRWAIVYRDDDGNSYWYDYDVKEFWLEKPSDYPPPHVTTTDKAASFQWLDCARWMSHGTKDRLRIKRVKFTVKPRER